MNVNAGGDLIIANGTETHYAYERIDHESSLLGRALYSDGWGGKTMPDQRLKGDQEYERKNTTQAGKVIKSELSAGGDVNLTSADDMSLTATRLQAGNDVNINASDELSLHTAMNSYYSDRSESKKNTSWHSSKGNGITKETAQYNEIEAGGDVNITAARVTADITQHKGESLDDALARVTMDKPELAYLNDLRNNPNVNWQKVNEAYKSWDYAAQGLTQEAAIIIVIVVTIVTMGSGTVQAMAAASAATVASAGTATYAAAYAASMAAMSSIASQVSVSMINNKGDIGGVLKDVASDEYLKSLAISVATAGLTGGAANLSGINVNPETLLIAKGAGVAERLQYAAIQTTVNGGVTTLINGGDLGQNILDAGRTAGVLAIGGTLSQGIGDLKFNGTIGQTEGILLHGALGCAIGAGLAGDCASGAAGSAVAELVGEMLYERGISLDRSVNAGKISGALAGAFIGGDVDVAYQAGVTSVENNLSVHAMKQEILDFLALVGRGDDPISQAIENGINSGVAMSMDKYPEQTMATLKALDMLGQLGGAVVTFVDGATGKVVSTSWNSLNPATQQQILGGGKILGVAFTAAQVAKIGGMVGSLESGVVKSTLEANKIKGAEFENKIITQKQKIYPKVDQQITVKTESGTKTRIDIGIKDSNENCILIECKSSATAPLTRNQKAAFPEIEKSGGTVVGKGTPNFPSGSKIPPTEIKIIRP